MAAQRKLKKKGRKVKKNGYANRLMHEVLRFQTQSLHHYKEMSSAGTRKEKLKKTLQWSEGWW